MRVYLADLMHNQVLGSNVISGNQDYVVPLNVASIAAFLDQQFPRQLEIKIFKEPELLIDAAIAAPPDVIGLSCYIWNNDLDNAVGSYLRTLYPDCLILMGGPSIRDGRDGIRDFLAARPYLDLFVTFEGEWAIATIVERLLEGGRNRLLSDAAIANCAWLREGDLVYAEPCSDHDVEQLPSPYLTGWLDPFLAQGLIPLFETNRGCPFKCTFCVWGVSALNNVRKYDISRVYAEFDYVAQRYPDMQGWILADANFGILKRDLDIAAKIRDVKEATPALKHILTWESKNTSVRNVEIAKRLGGDVGHQLIAVQTLDAGALDAIKRTNIKFATMPERIRDLHGAGTTVSTHVLSGLPRESLDGQLDTLRKCFDLGFDDIAIFSTILIPGSEMESAEARSQYGLKTKYRIRQGNYGVYRGIKSIDSEEIIRSTAAINEDDMLFLRGVHWLVWYGWNHGFLKPLLKYIHRTYHINPVEIILGVLKDRKQNKSFPTLSGLLENFYDDASREWFSSHEELKAHYGDPDNWANLKANGYSKVEFVYNSRMIVDRAAFSELLEFICTMLDVRAPGHSARTVAQGLLSCRIEVDDILSLRAAAEKFIELPAECVPDFLSNVEVRHHDGVEKTVTVRLHKADEELSQVRQAILEFDRSGSRAFAVEKTLGKYPQGFLYDLSLADEKRTLASVPEFLERVA
jgi:radical SAM superfamily enzyme YgiQ (UPF0313 family)